ncbi:MAG: DUF2079 domain-containing protein [Candidatus Levyibacteriota bacterium]
MKWLSIFKTALPYLICFFFFICYSTLSVVRHNHFQSYGFDLGITDQIVWEYSHFKAPITTVHYYPFTSILTDHIELIFAPLSIFYWIWNDPRMLLLLQAAFMCFSALPLYFLAKDKKLTPLICYAILLGYLMFYGIQNALWFDVHSAVFGASFLAWFIYFFDKKKYKATTIFFLLAILCKENVALLTALISIVYFIKRKNRKDLVFFTFSGIYLFLIFGVYFPHFTKLGYEYESTNGLIGNINLSHFFNTANKREVFFVSFGSFGFLPLLSPFSLLPFLGDLFSYFVVGNNIKEADGIFMHYRVTLAPLITWSTVLAISEIKRLNRNYTALYLLVSLFAVQYFLHLPLSYLTKNWFWNESSAVKNINTLLPYLPPDASVVAQNNITPHLSHRTEIFTLWPEQKKFDKKSPCRHKKCNWLMWKSTSPRYLIVDTSPNWDIRHFLANRPDFIDAIDNLLKEGYIKKDKQIGNATLYTILKRNTQ